MTYAGKFGRYGIYADSNLYKWFKDYDKALASWREMTKKTECVEEWLEEYDMIALKDMRTNEVLESFS